MNKKLYAVFIVMAALAAAAYVFIRLGDREGSRPRTGIIRVVAAENFYGDIAEQLGGDYVSVASILSNPSVDPHEYEPTVRDGIAVTDADIVIENGLKYDTWMEKLLSASPNPNRIVIVAGNAAPRILSNNPHIWYGIDNAAALAASITQTFEKIDPANSPVFEEKLAAFNGSLVPLRQKMDGIKAKYAGTPVALTETMYLYQAQPMELDVVTPPDFLKAIEGGNDPSAGSVNIADNQLSRKKVRILIYNTQTVTPVTTNLKNIAQERSIPVVAISETMSSNMTYVTWMMDELDNVEQGLAPAAGR